MYSMHSLWMQWWRMRLISLLMKVNIYKLIQCFHLHASHTYSHVLSTFLTTCQVWSHSSADGMPCLFQHGPRFVSYTEGHSFTFCCPTESNTSPLYLQPHSQPRASTPPTPSSLPLACCSPPASVTPAWMGLAEECGSTKGWMSFCWVLPPKLWTQTHTDTYGYMRTLTHQSRHVSGVHN